MTSFDTITAQATPPGLGGVAVVRVSGPAAKEVMLALLGKEIPPRTACYLPFYDQRHDIIDHGIAIYFAAPNSFTGEEVIEFQGHGGRIVIDLLLAAIMQQNVRMARPGEFSERAFLNNKLDLAQAEAIADLINASSKMAARSALRSLQGDFSRAVNLLTEKITTLRVYVEAAIDFIDEEIDFLSDAHVLQAVATILDELSVIQGKAQQGALLREGITVVIAGAPNVGKSSLLNALSGEELAIVTPIAGTTRDLLRTDIVIDGMPIHVIDTAGLRDSADIIEQEGIRRAYAEMEKADLIFYVMAAAEDVAGVCAAPATHNALAQEIAHKESSVQCGATDALLNESSAHKIPLLNEHSLYLATIPASIRARPLIVIRNKIDLSGEMAGIRFIDDTVVINLSAKEQLGLQLLRDHIKGQVGFSGDTENTFIARRRHLDALVRAEKHMHAAQVELGSTKRGELAAEDLRQAQLALAEITGEFSSDDLLGRIFSSFCIGK